MSLARYGNWPSLEQWQGGMDRLFSGLEGLAANHSDAYWQPRVDIHEFEDRFELLVDLPGVDPEQVELNLQEGKLDISGERSLSLSDDSAQHRRSERLYGQFKRSFQLPDNVDTQNVSARSAHGVITISLPKRAQSQAIKVQIAS